MTRERHVFKTEEIPHKWAHQTQSEARNHGNLSFSGPDLFSYNTCIAKIYTRGKDKHEKKLVLLSRHRYSATTSGHLNMASQAVSHLDSMEVSHVVSHFYEKDRHALNIKAFLNIAEEAMRKAKRSLKEYSVQYSLSTYQSALKDARDYRDFFKLKGFKIPALAQKEWDAALARVKRIEHPDPKSKLKRERDSAARLARKTAEEQERAEIARVRRLYMPFDQMIEDHKGFIQNMAERSSWRLGLENDWDSPRIYRSYQHNEKPMLKVEGESVVTSMGARVPLEAAPRIWSVVEACRRSKIERSAERGLHIKLDGFGVDKIEADGTLHVGCHVIPHSEMRMMARQLKLVPANWRP